MDEKVAHTRRFQFTLLALLICISSFGAALGSFRLGVKYIGAYPALGMSLYVAAGTFWGGGFGVLFGRFRRCAILGAITVALLLAIVKSSAGESIWYFLRKNF